MILKPSKINFAQGSPEVDNAAIAEEGPGIGITLILALYAADTNL